MELRDYFKSLKAAAKDDFAQRAGTTRIYVHQLISRSPKTARRPSAELALKLREASGNVVSLSSMRPDVWPSTPREDSGIELDPAPAGRS